MFRVRRIHDDILPVNREALAQIRAIFELRFAGADPADVRTLGEKLRNPFRQRFRTILFAAEDRRRVLAFAHLLHDPEIGFAWLDYIAAAPDAPGGVGAALYERVREKARALEVKGLFLEALPDEPGACDEELLPDNAARLQFYERFGVRPIVGTAYETPTTPRDTCPPHLLYDGLGTDRPLRRAFARQVVRAVLERKYRSLCPPDYVAKVVESFRDDPVLLRPARYLPPAEVDGRARVANAETVVLVVSQNHELHHVRERGYVESPVRVASILAQLEPTGIFERRPVEPFDDGHVLAVHDGELISYLQRASAEVPEGRSLYPYVFPVRNKTRPPRDPSVLPGYYCIDTFTPVSRAAWPAARHAVDVTLTAADAVLEGARLAYALVRPPGHHAERSVFGGFCYLNNAAVAAHYLSGHGRVAILDLDYHHGNGQQDIFYRRGDVFTVSIHGAPEFAYPYFTGFDDEHGEGPGEGANLNIPLPEACDGQEYRRWLLRALRAIEEFRPVFLVVALGLDTARGDPTGTWSLRGRDFDRNGRLVGELGLPTLVVQEGGYRTRTLGTNARAFFTGLAVAARRAPDLAKPTKGEPMELTFRSEPRPEDPARVREIVATTGYFRPDEVDVAVELVDERLAKGPESGYEFVFAERGGRVVGYACFGLIPCTVHSWDLYWIAVDPATQGRGLGRLILSESERRIREAGGARVYVETSGKPQYESTRVFYDRCDYRAASILDDFYAPGDSKYTYVKAL